jgi:serine/threonine-protein kinase
MALDLGQPPQHSPGGNALSGEGVWQVAPSPEAAVRGADGFLFAAYEYVLPFDARALLRHRRAPRPSHRVACTVAYQAALALHAMHQQTDGRRSALHEALDVSNLWVTAEGDVRLTGLPDLREGRRLLMRLVHTYSPEALSGKAEPRSDVFALAIATWELLTGQPMVAVGQSDFEKLEYVRSRTPRDPREVSADIPAEIASVILRALAPDPADRPRDSASFAAELAAFSVPGPYPLADLVREVFEDEIVRDLARWSAALAG